MGLLDRAAQIVSTVGTDTTLVLGLAVDVPQPIRGFRTIADAGATDDEWLEYYIQDNAAWEFGSIQFDAGGPGLKNRTPAWSSDGANTAIALSGNAQIFIGPTAALLYTRTQIDALLSAKLSALADDPDPTLGADLDLNGNEVLGLTADQVAVADTAGNFAGTNAETIFAEIGAALAAIGVPVQLKGSWDASTGAFPGGGAAKAGWSYIVGVGGTVDGVVFTANDRIVAIANNASTATFAANWFKMDYTDQVLTVAGKTGAVTLQVADITDMSANGRSLTQASYATMKALLDLEIGVDVQGYDPDTLFADTPDVLTAGFAATPHDAGNKTAGTFTPSEANGNFQYCTNNGAHALAPPVNNCTLVIQYTNGATAGAINTSAFTKVTGDDPSTVNGDDFFMFITKCNGFSHLHVQALQ